MREDCVHQLFLGGLELHGDHEALDHLRHFGADQMGAEQATGLGIEDGLDDLLKAPPRDKIIDVAVKQQMQEAMSTAMKNAEFDSRTNTVKMVVNL